jgi:hypothetical protein
LAHCPEIITETASTRHDRPKLREALIDLPTLLVAVRIGVTVPGGWLATSAVLPSGVIAICRAAETGPAAALTWLMTKASCVRPSSIQ